MNILVDGHMIGNNEGGNERYTLNLFKSLSSLNNKNLRFHLLINKLYEHKKSVDYNNLFRMEIDDDFYRLIYKIPSIVRANKIQIAHSNYISPFIKNCKSVITVHDVSFKRFPGFYSLKDRIIFDILLPNSLKRSDAIIVPSNFTRK